MSKRGRTKLPPSKSMSRKDKRKAERKLKKARKDAFAHRDFGLVSDLKTVDTAFKAKNQKEREERLKLKKKKKKVVKKEEKKEVESSRVQGLRLAIQRDEKELKQLEKNLNFRKKKGKTSLPSSFVKDGLDYILDATDSDKIKTFEDVVPGIEGLGASDTESPSESEEYNSDEEDQSEAGPGPGWDPTAKAEKSILKAKKDQKKNEKSVKFNVNEPDTDESDPFEDNFSDTEFGGGGDVSDDEEAEMEEEEEEDEDLGDADDDDDDMAEEHEGDVEDVESESLKRKRGENEEDDSELKEDIYGRLRDKQGNIVIPGHIGTYVPPAKRAMMAGSQGNEQLRKKLKGFLNKVSEGAMQAISSQVEALYLDNSRADVNETMTSLIMEAIVTPVITPERLVAETAMLIAILHSNVGTEIGAYFIQTVVKKFDELLQEVDYGAGKLMDNVLLIIASIYNFKIIHSKLIFGIVEKFIESFQERDIELLLLVLKTVGFSLRKDDPVRLKQAILDIQAKARIIESSAEVGMQARVRFMLDVLVAVRNNNMRKIPSYDPSHIEHLRKVVRNFLKGQGLGEDQLSISLEDLLKADQVGRWWIVGSAWEGRKAEEDVVKEAKFKTETGFSGTISKQMLKLAKQQGMNTDIRRHIFCILGTSEDFEDAFARLLRLGLNRSQEREIIHVLLHCCLNEKEYNPFYSYLAQKFCSFDRRFTMTVQFSVWDKFKEIDQMSKPSQTKLGHLLSHLLLGKGLSLSIFKVVEFGMESKIMIRLLAQVLTEILTSPNETTVREAFERIAPFPKLKTLRQGLQVFMRIHLRNKKTEGNRASNVLLLERIEKAESAMFSHQSSHALL